MIRRLSIAAMLVLILALAAAAHTESADPATPLNPATWRGDVRFLVAAVDSIHPRPYARHSRAAWDSAAADLERRLPRLRYDQAVAGFMRMMTLLEDGHSRLDQLDLAGHTEPHLTPLPGPGMDVAYPLECRVFADGMRVVRATAPHRALLGARVVAIDGVPVAEAVARVSAFIPTDNAMWTLDVLPAFLRVPGYLDAAGLASGPAAPLRLTLEDARGRRREASVAAERPDSAARWIAADADVRAPLPLTRALPEPWGYADLGDGERTVFVRIREIGNAPGGATLAQFVARLFAHADSIGARRMILDLRGNGGGNNYLNQPLVHALIRRPALSDRVGGLFAIVDRGTFSAAVSLCDDLQRETRVRFVGEPTGAAPNSPGDPAHVRLPASGIVVRISTVLWQLSDPRDPREFVAPDVPVAETWSDWLAHRDPALPAIAAWHPPDEPDEAPNTRWATKAQLEAKSPTIAW
ncbi:MAG TPA: hypothetical protein VFK69_07055 [Candidatus Eisenbacteria bacterium]|nr:hypothetical protein [Candidatus Eisenbacteria bacterium]